MRAKCLCAAFDVPTVFDHGLDASSAFIAASCAIAALVFVVVVGVTLHGCCLVIGCGFQRCGCWLIATGPLDVVGDAFLNRVFCVLLLCSVSGTLGSVALGFILKTVASSF